MPAGDIAHPVPDLTGYITEGQLVLSQDLHVRGIYPPFDPLRSLSRLMRLGAGPGRTRDDHLELSAQLYALVSLARRAADLAEIVGLDALGPIERAHLRFAEAFEQRLVRQGLGEQRSLEDTLERAWDAISTMPESELGMLSRVSLEHHYRRGQDAAANPTG